MNARFPHRCRLEAFELFADSLPLSNSTDRLLQAATAVSMHALDDAAPRQVEEYLEQLAERVRSRVRQRSTEAILAHLHAVLFDEEGFHGAGENYYQPISSYLPTVVALRRGIPVSLALVYKGVGERVGLQVQGVNAPGHFLVRVRDNCGWMYIDPFFGGQVLTEREAVDRIARALGRSLQSAENLLQPATHEEWIARLLTNLRYIFAANDLRFDLGAMSELQQLLQHSP